MKKALIYIVTVCIALTASYLLANAGEPQSVWLWRDVLGVLK